MLRWSWEIANLPVSVKSPVSLAPMNNPAGYRPLAEARLIGVAGIAREAPPVWNLKNEFLAERCALWQKSNGKTYAGIESTSSSGKL